MFWHNFFILFRFSDPKCSEEAFIFTNISFIFSKSPFRIVKILRLFSPYKYKYTLKDADFLQDGNKFEIAITFSEVYLFNVYFFKFLVVIKMYPFLYAFMMRNFLLSIALVE